MPPKQRAAALAGAEGAGWIEAAAGYGLVEAQVLWGQSLLGSNPALAFRWFSGAAAAGYPPAVNMLGRCLEKGWGTAVDLPASAVHYRNAAEKGCDWAQYNLANLLLYGLGVRKDRIEAYAWYGQAAAKGHAKAMNMLGRFHEEGWDRPRDLPQAIFWYQSAADGGDYRGQFNLGTILVERGARQEASAWFATALASGDPDFRSEAATRLGRSADPVLATAPSTRWALPQDAAGTAATPASYAREAS